MQNKLVSFLVFASIISAFFLFDYYEQSKGRGSPIEKGKQAFMALFDSYAQKASVGVDGIKIEKKGKFDFYQALTQMADDSTKLDEQTSQSLQEAKEIVFSLMQVNHKFFQAAKAFVPLVNQGNEAYLRAKARLEELTQVWMARQFRARVDGLVPNLAGIEDEMSFTITQFVSDQDRMRQTLRKMFQETNKLFEQEGPEGMRQCVNMYRCVESRTEMFQQQVQGVLMMAAKQPSDAIRELVSFSQRMDYECRILLRNLEGTAEYVSNSNKELVYWLRTYVFKTDSLLLEDWKEVFKTYKRFQEDQENYLENLMLNFERFSTFFNDYNSQLSELTDSLTHTTSTLDFSELAQDYEELVATTNGDQERLQILAKVIEDKFDKWGAMKNKFFDGLISLSKMSAEQVLAILYPEDQEQNTEQADQAGQPNMATQAP